MEIAVQNWVGEKCSSVDRGEHGIWFLVFGEAGTLSAQLWRILAYGGIALCREDDGHQFGLPSPVDAEARARDLLVGKTVTKVEIADRSSDLSLTFEDGAVFQAVNTSMGYEGWHAVCRSATGNKEVIALGGGDLAMFNS